MRLSGGRCRSHCGITCRGGWRYRRRRHCRLLVRRLLLRLGAAADHRGPDALRQSGLLGQAVEAVKEAGRRRDELVEALHGGHLLGAGGVEAAPLDGKLVEGAAQGFDLRLELGDELRADQLAAGEDRLGQRPLFIGQSLQGVLGLTPKHPRHPGKTLPLEGHLSRLAAARARSPRAIGMPATIRSAMQLPGIVSLAFLAYLLFFLPWAALRSARWLRAAQEGREEAPSRLGIWISTLLSQAILLLFAWFTGRGFDYEIFALPPLDGRDLLATLLTLTICFALLVLAHVMRSAEERRTLLVYALVPQSHREWGLGALTVVVASVAEEAAYRGVGMAILVHILGNPWPAALVCAVAFAFAHSIQGWKSGVVIFVLALVMHALVVITGTLVLAMGVHAIFDVVAIFAIRREARRHGVVGLPPPAPIS